MSDPEQPAPIPPGDDDPVPAEPDASGDDDSIVDRMRGTGVGVEDPTIVGDPQPGPVDAEVAEDTPPEV